MTAHGLAGEQKESPMETPLDHLAGYLRARAWFSLFRDQFHPNHQLQLTTIPAAVSETRLPHTSSNMIPCAHLTTKGQACRRRDVTALRLRATMSWLLAQGPEPGNLGYSARAQEQPRLKSVPDPVAESTGSQACSSGR